MLDQVSQTQISGVSGYSNTGNVTLNGNGTESGQTNAVIFPFDNVNEVINRPGGSFYNTIPGNPTGISDTLQIVIDFVSPIDPTYLLAAPPYNPFVFTDNVRGKELHLVDGEPTALVDPTFFGTDKDNSNPGSGKYNRSVDSFCWAVDIPEYFDYPVEKADIVTAHLKFAQWCQSGGATFDDWYKNKSGYRNTENIY